MFFNFGAAYTARIIDIPASTGHGEPIQRFFKLKDGGRIVAAFSLDTRVIGDITTRKEGVAPPVHAVAVSSDGYSARFSFEPFVEPSTCSVLTQADEVNYLSGPGRGVILIKLNEGDRVLGFIASRGDRDLMVVGTSRGAEQTISTTKYKVTGRGGKGRELLQRGQFTRVVTPLPEAPTPFGE